MSDAEAADIIIVGAGGSGLAAAVSAAENGADVLVLEKRAEPGGTTGIAVGSFTANRTEMQRKAGIEDTLDDHAEDAGKFAAPEIEARNNDALRRYFLGEGAATLAWLQGMGLSFHGPSPEPPNRVPRMHNVVPAARAYIATLSGRFRALGGRIQCNARVVDLIKEGERVVGVVADIGGTKTNFRAGKGVVLAAGDYTNSPELIARYKGEGFSQVEGIDSESSGDGHRLVDAVGGRLVNMDVTYGPELRFVAPTGGSILQRLPTRGPLAWLAKTLLPIVPDILLRPFIKRLLVTWQHPEDGLLEDGGILVNHEGERFCDELTSPSREIAVSRQPNKECFFLLDRRVAERYSAWPHFISTAPKIAYAYVDDYLQLRPDIADRAPTLERVAELRGVPAEALKSTVRSYNEAIAGEAPDPWDRGERTPLQDGDWALLGPARAYFTTTEGGAAINEQFQVLDNDGAILPGLYAIGQTGLGGQVLWGHGLHIGWAMTSGRLVGAQLA